METLATKKITMATLKSFIKKNREALQINCQSRFNSMSDMVEHEKSSFKPVVATDRNPDHTLGIQGAWVVGQSRDYLKYYNKDGFQGIEVYNACGSFIIAIKEA